MLLQFLISTLLLAFSSSTLFKWEMQVVKMLYCKRNRCKQCFPTAFIDYAEFWTSANRLLWLGEESRPAASGFHLQRDWTLSQVCICFPLSWLQDSFHFHSQWILCFSFSKRIFIIVCEGQSNCSITGQSSYFLSTRAVFRSVSL